MSEMESRCKPYLQRLFPEPYASVVPDRNPAVKFHTSVRYAKRAVALRNWKGARGGEIYELSENGWRLLYRVEEDTPSAELPWAKPAASH